MPNLLKTVILTGPARGLGLAISERLLKDGYRVIGIGRTLTDAYQALIDAPGAGEAHFIHYDLSDIKGIPALVTGITREHGALTGW